MNIKTKILSLLLAAVMLASAIPITVSATSDADALAFGKQDGTAVTATVTLSPSHLLALLVGETLTDAEIAYLDRYCDRILEYYDRIPADRVSVRSSTSEARVTAKAYAYTAENGTTVTWVPTAVAYNEQETPLTQNGENYEATVAVDEQTGDRLGIVYTSRLSIPASVVNALANFAYTDAMAARDLPTTAEYTAARAAYVAYEEALADYEDAKTAYELYRAAREEYETEKAKYDAYVVKKAEYDKQYTAYEQYEKDMLTYATARAEYERVYRENSAIMEDYHEYLTNLNRIRASMYAMESLFERPTSHKTGTLFQALQNFELVTMFERYRDELVKIYGVSNDTLTHLRTTSDELNEMLRAYAEARETSEEAAFAYYKEHYHEIAYLFNYLYDNMREIMTGMIFNHICAKMELEYTGEMLTYKKWRVKNVLAHIYLICQVLDDAETADGTFHFYAENGKKHTYYFSDLLEQNLILTDNNDACPDDLTWLPVVEPVELPTAPVEPTPVERPVPPQTVSEPTEPTPVEEPGEAPTPVPETPEATAAELALYAFADRAAPVVAALKAGTLTARDDVTEAQTLTLTKTLTRPISFSDGYLVTFYDVDGELLDVKTEVFVGDEIPLPSTTPTYDDAQYTYAFAGWATSPEADPDDLPAIPAMPESDLAFYAIYRKTVKRYAVTVKLHENDLAPTVTYYDYGTVPSLPESPARSAPDTVYTFAGWSPTPTAVTGNVTYTAQWLTTERLYTVTWITTDGTTTRRLPYQSTPTPPTIPAVYYEGCVRYDFIGWGKTVVPVTADVTYEAQYRRTVLAESENEELTLVPSLGEYHLTGSGARADVEALITTARNENKRVTIDFPSVSVSLDPTAVAALQSEGAAYVASLSDTAGGVGIGLYDADGRALTASTGIMHLSLSYTAVAGATPCVLATDASGNVLLTPASLEGDTLVVAATANKTYRADYQYALTLKGEGGTLFANASRYFVGEKPSLTTYPAPNHLLSSITLTNDLNGETVTLSSLGDFTMPAYPATLTVSFVPKTYTVTFISRGVTVSEVQYVLGDTVIVPEIETDFEEGGYRHTFIGWSSPIGTVTGDVTYTAKFYSVSIEEMPQTNSDGTAWAMGTVLWQIGLPAVLILGGLITGTVFLVRGIRKKKRAKKK